MKNDTINKTFPIIATLIVIAIIILCAIRILSLNSMTTDTTTNVSQTPNNPTNATTVELDSGTFLAMGTLGHIKIIADNETHAINAMQSARAELNRLDKLISTYRQDSELSKINKVAAIKPVKVSNETFKLLKLSIKFSKLSNGNFDITITPLINLWKKLAKENRLPTKKEIEQAKKYVGYDKIILDDKSQTVRLKTKGTLLNVNAIAKGYIIDYMINATKKIPGVKAALIEIGGEIRAFGKDWIIGIENPFEATEKGNPLQAVKWKIKINNQAVATSGNYRRYVTIKGKQYSHIINPHTAMSADKIPSVTIIAPTTANADALATAVSVLGVKKGLNLIEHIDNTEAFIVTGTKNNIQIYKTKGFDKYLTPN